MIDILFLCFWWLFLLGSPFVAVSLRRWWYVFLSLFLIVGGGTVAWCYYRDAYPEAVVREDSMVRVGPHETYGICGAIKAKDRVVICKSCGDWRQIQKFSPDDWFYIKGGIRGWVPHDCVMLVSANSPYPT